MISKSVGIKEFQARLAESFPHQGETILVTKRNIPTYTISALSLDSQAFLSASDIQVCPTCGQIIKDVNKNRHGGE